MKKIVFIMTLIMLLVPSFVLAQDFSDEIKDSGAIFTMYPSYTHQGNKSWIIHDLEPGDSVEDYLTVENLSDNAMRFKVFFVEGVQDGVGVLTKSEDDQAENIGKLIQMDSDFVDLGPREKSKVRFTYFIPEGFEQGEYLGVFYAEPTGSSDGLSSDPMRFDGVSVNTRIGVRMYVNVSSAILDDIQASTIGATDNQKMFLLLSGALLVLTFVWNLASYKKRNE